MLRALFLFCFLPLTSVMPMSLSEVLITVMGTDDIAKLQRIAKDPMAYWEERRKALFEGEDDNRRPLYSNQEFLKIFTRQTKERCQYFIKQDKGELAHDKWYKKLDDFEDVLCDICPEGDSRHAFIKATAYANLCDQLLFDTTEGEKGEHYTPLDFETTFIKDIENCFRTSTVQNSVRRNKEMLWLFEKNGLFSMWDCLVIMGEGYYLGSSFKNSEDRENFCAHSGVFSGHSGSLAHDHTHASAAATYFDAFAKFEVNLATYIKDCLKENNTEDSIIALCQKVFTAFSTFHEVVFKKGDNTPEKLIFPPIIVGDPGMLDIMGGLLGADEELLKNRTTAQYKAVSRDSAVEILTKWRQKYFGKVRGDYVALMRTQ